MPIPSFDKLSAYIELLNNGLKPKNYDPKTYFNNGTPVNQYWAKNREKIINELNTNPKYQRGYEVAKKTIQNYLASLIENRVSEYIELLNSGILIPKDKDTEHTFSDGRKINNFWPNNKDRIREELNTNPKYQRGYEVAQKIVRNYLSSLATDKIAEYIELLNQGIPPTSNDKTHQFSDGSHVNKYWANNKENILYALENDPQYQRGYEVAKKTVKEYLDSLSFDKTAEYIDLLNQGKITPISYDPTHFFSNSEAINYYWSNKKEEIINELNTNPQYQRGYEVAKEIINKYLASLQMNKTAEYIVLLNNQTITPQNFDPTHFFSNGEPINHYWNTHKEEILNELSANPKYQRGYEVAKRVTKEYQLSLTFDRIDDYIKLLNSGQLTPSTYERRVTFTDGKPINKFWAHKKNEIINRLKQDPKYQNGYEVAKKIVSDYLISLTIDKVAEYIELLNNETIKIKDCDKEHFFSNGDAIHYFWSNNKENIIARLHTEEKYKQGYQKALNQIIAFTNRQSTNKIAEYIELLNKGYIPCQNETILTFSNGEIIGYYWDYEEIKRKIAYELNHNPQYQDGYEVAKKTVNDLTHLINALGGNEERATKIYSALQNLRQKRNAKKRKNPSLESILEEFDININTLNVFLNRTSPSSKRQPRLKYKGESLKNYCIQNGYNYKVIYRLLKMHTMLPEKNFDELVELVIDNYRHNGQNKPTLWIYEKYGVLLKHILLLINIDSNGILYNMRKYCISLEEAMRHEIFKRNIPNKKYNWLEELFNYLVEEMDENKSQDELTTNIANKFYELSKSYDLTEEERSILYTILEKYISSIRKYLSCCFVLEQDPVQRIEKARRYNLSGEEIEEAYFLSLRVQNKMIINEDHPYVKHLSVLRKYYLVWHMLTKEQQEYVRKTENIKEEDVVLMDNLNHAITTTIRELNSETFTP